MSDDREATQAPGGAAPDHDVEERGRDEYEDLLADLGDVAAIRLDEDEGNAMPGPVKAGQEQELESFLDEFERRQGGDEAPLEESVAGDDEFDVLDLSEAVGRGEPDAPPPGVASEEEPFEPPRRAAEETTHRGRRDEAPAAADQWPETNEPPAEFMEHEEPSAPLGEGQGEARNRRSVLGALAIFLALAAATVSVVMSYRVQEQVADLSSSMAEPEGAALLSVPPSAASEERSLDAVRRLSERVEELAVIIEGPMGHVRETGQRELENIGLRLNTIEDELTRMQQAIDEVKTRVDTRVLPAMEPDAGGEEPSADDAATAPKTVNEREGAEEGQWAINLSSYTREDVADAALERLHEKGIDAIKQVAEQQGRTWYRVRVTGLPGRDEAETLAREIEAETGLDRTWVVKE